MSTPTAVRRTQTASHPIWIEKPSVGLRVAKAITLGVIAVVMLFPFVYVLSVSLSTQQDLTGSAVTLIPRHLTLEAYRQVLAGGVVGRALMVSVVITVVGTVVSMVMTTTLAYGLTRTRHVPGSRSQRRLGPTRSSHQCRTPRLPGRPTRNRMSPFPNRRVRAERYRRSRFCSVPPRPESARTRGGKN